MILTYHEGSCIRAQAGSTTLVFGPVSKQSKKFKPTNFGADVVFVSLNHPDMNGAEEVERRRPQKDSPKAKQTYYGVDPAAFGVGNQPFVISGPGEYEVKDMSAAGFPSGSKWGLPSGRAGGQDGTPLTNTIYSVHFDGLSLMYLGALGDLDLPADVLEMDSPDILVVPVGGGGALTSAEAQKLAVKLEAKIVIPVLHDSKSLKQFLKEAGEDVKAVDKLTVKPRDVAGKEGDVVVLSP